MCDLIILGWCFSWFEVIALFGLSGMVGIAFSLVYVYQKNHKENTDQHNSFSGQSEENSSTWVEEQDDYYNNDHPFPIGALVLAGEDEEYHEAYLKVVRYNDEDSEIVVNLLVEIPLEAEDAQIDYEDDEDGDLGKVSVKFRVGPKATEIEIWLKVEELEDYTVVVNKSETTTEDLHSTLL